MHPRRIDHRAEHRLQESVRINASPNLAKRFNNLKSLTVELQYYDAGAERKTSEIKYTVNLENAKSVFAFACPNTECVRGDFDLTEKLASAIGAQLESTDGEACCQGWRSKTTIDSVRCLDVLRYKFSMTY
ncbi:MAG TPA: hypothetical protein VMZ27_08920 [Candidatus Saccharimonadales bacterium]|nr:hypothetical protein [Candidatus Saccharimonadales bacterium]